MPVTSSASNPDHTSSRAKGLTMAVTSIIGGAPSSAARGERRRRSGGPAAPTSGATGPGDEGVVTDRAVPDRSDRVAATLSRADPDDGVDRGDPDLPVTDLAGAGGLDDGVDDLVREGVVGDDLHPDLRHEVDRVLGTAVDLGVALLAAVALDLAHRHPQHPDLLQGTLDVLEDERLDDRRDQLHLLSSPCSRGPGRARRPSRSPRPDAGCRRYRRWPAASRSRTPSRRARARRCPRPRTRPTPGTRSSS